MSTTRLHPGPDAGALRNAMVAEYDKVARDPHQSFHFHTGRALAGRLDYDPEVLDGLPAGVVDSFAGTANPFVLGSLEPGERVVDVACGAGMDSLIAGGMVGPEGRVVGVDMTPAMIEKARNGALELGFPQVEFRAGDARNLPVPDGWADVVISNGAMNLFPDKPAALREMARALRPGGRIQVADILLQLELPDHARGDVALWTGCIAGGLTEPELREAVALAGFRDLRIFWGIDVFSGAPQASSASRFGTRGITFGCLRA